MFRYLNAVNEAEEERLKALASWLSIMGDLEALNTLMLSLA